MRQEGIRLNPRGREVSIHAPWEGCDYLLPSFHILSAVSIHAPWEGCDVHKPLRTLSGKLFQFTHPGKGATSGDPLPRLPRNRFNSRTLGRVRHKLISAFSTVKAFQFTHPGKGATINYLIYFAAKIRFNSRTLGRVRLSSHILCTSFCSFNSRTLGRVRRHTLHTLYNT